MQIICKTKFMRAVIDVLCRMKPGHWHGRGELGLKKENGGTVLRSAVNNGFMEYRRDEYFGEYKLTPRGERTAALLQHIGF